MITFRTLGRLRLERGDGTPVCEPLRHAKCLALLSFLAASEPGQFHRREKLTALLWPEADEEHGRAMLRKCVFHLRRWLGPESLPGRGNDEVGLDPGRFWSDAWAFREALDGGRDVEALDLYRGDFLDGVHVRGAPDFERWAEVERGSLRTRALRGALALANRTGRESDDAAATAWAERALEIQPFDEGALRLLVTCLDRRGRRASAVGAYEGFRTRLAQELEIEPAPETRELIDAVRRRREPHGDGHDPSEGRTGAAADGSMPVSLAVLPLDPVDDGGRSPAASVHAELLCRLSGQPGLKVVSRTTVTAHLREPSRLTALAGRLDADYVMEGAVRSAGGRYRVTAEVIDAVTDTAVWAGSAEGTCRAGIPDQVRVAHELADEVAAALAQPGRPAS